MEIVLSAHTIERLGQLERLDAVAGTVRDEQMEVLELKPILRQRSSNPRLGARRETRDARHETRDARRETRDARRETSERARAGGGRVKAFVVVLAMVIAISPRHQ